MVNVALPRAATPIVSGQGIPTREFYNFLLSLASTTTDAALQAQITALAARVLALEQGTSDAPVIQGLQSVLVQGSWQGGIIQIVLQGDVLLPGMTFYYGTGPTGEKGFFAISDTILAEPDELTKSVGLDGITTLGLADVTPEPGGTLQKYGFDAKGRRSEEQAATTDDLSEGASNIYFTDERAQDAVGAILTDTADIEWAYGPGSIEANLPAAVHADLALAGSALQPGDAIDWAWLTNVPANITAWAAIAPSAKEDSIATGTTAQFWRGDKTWSNALVGTLNLVNNVSAPGMLAGLFGLYVAPANSTPAFEMFDAFGTSTGAIFRRANGTAASPTAVGGNDLIGQFQARAHDGASYSANETCAIWFEANGSWSNSSHPSRISFFTTAVGAVSQSRRLVINSDGTVQPASDNAQSCGASSFRWSVIYAGTGTINTSDAREKSNIRDLTEQELACASELAGLACIYQWNEALAEKGDAAARLHCSPTVQSVIACMESHGLDPFRYGFVCYDQWDEQPEVRDAETGDVVEAARAAGDRYSLRPSELQFFIARGQEERLRRLEQAVNLTP